jgi:putative hydrolase of the HAD superfamily
MTAPAIPAEVVVFDVDDTLYLERDYVRSGSRAVGDWAAKNLGIRGFADLAWAAFEDGVRGTILDTALTGCGVEPGRELVGRMVEVYRTHVPAIALIPDAAECLRRLSGRVRMAVVTDGPLQSQRAKVQALGLEALVDLVILTEELGAGFGKPSPRAFELVEEQLAASGERCVYVADNPAKDFDGPALRGWRGIRIRRTAGLHRDVPSGPAVSLELPDLRALPDALGLEETDLVDRIGPPRGR